MVAGENGRHHRQVVVREVLAVDLRLEAHRFSGYCPELNPDEWAWSHRKNHELASYVPYDVRELRRDVRLGVLRISTDRPCSARSSRQPTSTAIVLMRREGHGQREFSSEGTKPLVQCQ